MAKAEKSRSAKPGGKRSGAGVDGAVKRGRSPLPAKAGAKRGNQSQARFGSVKTAASKECSAARKASPRMRKPVSHGSGGTVRAGAETEGAQARGAAEKGKAARKKARVRKRVERKVERSSLADPQPGDVLHRREVVEVTRGWVHYRITGSSDLKEMPKGLWPVLAKHPPLSGD